MTAGWPPTPCWHAQMSVDGRAAARGWASVQPRGARTVGGAPSVWRGAVVARCARGHPHTHVWRVREVSCKENSIEGGEPLVIRGVLGALAGLS